MVEKDRLIIVIGRGNGGTRIMSHTLSESGVFMGTTNDAGDLIPPEPMYLAARIAGSLVSMKSENNWDFTKLLSSEPTPQFISLVNEYIKGVVNSDNKNIGWKIPETLLSLPWIFKMFPNAYYIYWTRDIRDTVTGGHITDDLSRFNIENKTSLYHHNNRVCSYIYQRQIVDATPKPQKFLEIKFEDFVLNQEQTLLTISKFIGIPLVSIPVDENQVGCYKRHGAYIEQSIVDRYGYYA